jgi:hypothetical protein
LVQRKSDTLEQLVHRLHRPPRTRRERCNWFRIAVIPIDQVAVFWREGIQTRTEVRFAGVELGLVLGLGFEQQFGSPFRKLRSALGRPKKSANFDSREAKSPVEKGAFRIVLGEVPPQRDGTLLQHVARVRPIRHCYHYVPDDGRFVLNQQPREQLVYVFTSHAYDPPLRAKIGH